MRRLTTRWIACTILAIAPWAATRAADGVPGSAAEICPLPIGTALPDVGLRTATGESITLGEAVGGKRAILVFYRGGW